jgi:anti-anti-sigma regulatory factor
MLPVDRGAQTILIDLRGVDDLSPRLLRLLVRLYQYGRKAGHAVHLVSVSRNVTRSLEKIGLARLFTNDDEDVCREMPPCSCGARRHNNRRM